MARLGPPPSQEFNALFIAQGYGVQGVPFVGASFGLEIISGEAHSSVNQTMYTTKVTNDSFNIVLVYADYGEYDGFSRWLQNYATSVVDPNSGVGACRVICPAQFFDKTGVPTTGIDFGDAYDAKTYTLQIAFEGAEDSITINDGSSPFWSTFVPAIADPVDAPYFYPGGIQLSGTQAGNDEAFYEAAPNVPGYSGTLPIPSSPLPPLGRGTG